MRIRSVTTRRGQAAVALASLLALVPTLTLGAHATAADPASGPVGAEVDALTTSTYGATLEVGGSGPLAGAPLYAITSDSRDHFGCTTVLETTFQGPITCTGPESDVFDNVTSDEWPAFTTTGRPVAGPGVRNDLLGTVYRPGIGRQVTYAGHPLYLFDPPSSPFVPFGENFLETALPLPPWQGLWDLVSARTGAFDPGPTTVETETLPDGSTALASETYNNALPGGVAVTVYAFRADHGRRSTCDDCSPTWIPVLTHGRPQAAGGADPAKVGTVRIGPGEYQVTYRGQPLYLYSSEQAVFAGGQPQTTGTVGNGNGLSGPHGGVFSIVAP